MTVCDECKNEMLPDLNFNIIVVDMDDGRSLCLACCLNTLVLPPTIDQILDDLEAEENFEPFSVFKKRWVEECAENTARREAPFVALLDKLNWKDD